MDPHHVNVICELVTTGTSTTYEQLPVNPVARAYLDANFPEKTDLIREFDAAITMGIAEYTAGKTATSRVERIAAYDKFFTHPENMHRARVIQSTYTRPQPDNDIIARLQRMLKPGTRRHPVDLVTADNTKDPQLSLDDAIAHVCGQLDVSFTPRWYLGSVRLQFLNWYNEYNLHKFTITDNHTSRCIGNVILHESATLPPTTTPILAKLPLQIINTRGDRNYVHELTHAVHFSFVPYYEIPRDLVEITPMCMENGTRTTLPSTDELTRQAALAIADLTTDTPDEFNAIYSRLTNTHPVGDVRARMWHFTNMPFKYYSYPIGMASTNYAALSKAVRSSDRHTILACGD